MKICGLLAILAVVLFVLPQDARAEVKITSWNPAFFGGAIRIEGPTKDQRCSARFNKKGVEHVTSSGWRYFESEVTLPCDLTSGGRVVIEVNGRSVGFNVPAELIVHGGPKVHAVVRHIPYLAFYDFPSVEGAKLYSIDLDPIAKGGRCDPNFSFVWPEGIDYDGWLALKRAMAASILYKFVGEHPCAAWTKEKR